MATSDSGGYRGSTPSLIRRADLADAIARAAKDISGPSGVVAAHEALEARMDVLSENEFFGTQPDVIEGIFVATRKLFPLGSLVTLNLISASGEKLTVEGVVLWTRELSRQSLSARTGMGIGFATDLSEADQILIQRALLLHEPIEIPGDAKRYTP